MDGQSMSIDKENTIIVDLQNNLDLKRRSHHNLFNQIINPKTFSGIPCITLIPIPNTVFHRIANQAGRIL